MFFFGKPYEYRGKRSQMKPIDFQVLSLLQERGALTGYAIAKTLDERFRGLWTPSFGTIFPVLKRLENRGLVTKQAVAVGDRTGQSYSITEEGKQSLQHTLTDAEQELDLISQYLRRLVHHGGRYLLPKFAELIAQLLEDYEIPEESGSAETGEDSPSNQQEDDTAEQYREIYERILHRFCNFDPAVVFPPHPHKSPSPKGPHPKNSTEKIIPVEGDDEGDE